MRYAVIAPFAVAVAAWTMTAVSAHAQTSRFVVAVDVDRATQLESEAQLAQGDSRRWPDAASMLRRASHVRPPNDPIALRDLRTAGAIYGTIGDLQRAKETVLELADRATEFGEIAMAAHAYMDMAHIAVELRDVQAVRTYYERAQRLAQSSHLTGDERRSIAIRLERSPGLFASAVR
jgi:hypothetical protein